MLIAAAVRAPTSVAMALLTLAVSAASFVNSPVVRLVSGGLFEAQPLSPTAITARTALSVRIVLLIATPSQRLMVARLHRIERPASRLGCVLLGLLLLFHSYRRDFPSLSFPSGSSFFSPLHFSVL